MSEFEKYSLLIETANAVAAVAVPVLLAIGAIMLHRYTKAIDHRLDAEREGMERRAHEYKELTTLMNDIYCFTVLVGHYRTISPTDAVERKRRLEAIVFATMPMWDDQLLRATRDFIAACYVIKRGRGAHALLTSDVTRQKEERGSQWDASWEGLFLEPSQRLEWIRQEFGDVSFRNDVVKPRYACFLAAVGRAVGGGVSQDAALDMLRAG